MAKTAIPSINIDMTLGPLVNSLEEVSLHSKMKRKDDSIEIAYAKILDQSKKRLNSLDAQRIVSVVDDSVRKCEIVTLLPFIVENLDRYSVMLGSDLFEVLKEYDRTQQLYMKALSNVRKLRPGSSRPSSQISVLATIPEDSNNLYITENVSTSPEYIIAVENAHRMSETLSQCVQTIARIFKSNPVAVNTMKSQRNNRSYEANTLIDHLLSLREEVYNRLVTTASEEQDKQKMSVQILKREKKARAAIKKLEGELNKCTKEKKEMVS